MIDEAEVTRLHEAAMAYAHEAMTASGAQTATRLYQLAFENERNAAEALKSEKGEEPTRSILYRSAATLALDCHEYDEAERLIEEALAGSPPADVAQELRELHGKVKLSRTRDVPIKMPLIAEDLFEAKVTRILIKKDDYLNVDQIF